MIRAQIVSFDFSSFFSAMRFLFELLWYIISQEKKPYRVNKVIVFVQYLSRLAEFRYLFSNLFSET